MACKPKTKKGAGYMQESLETAVEEVSRGMSVRAAARMFSIPRTTLQDHVSGKSSKVGAGAPTVLSYCEEQEIVLTCQVLSEMGFGVTRELIGVVISDYIRENSIATPFANGMPGKDWWQRFLKRWPTLTERKPQHLSTHRAQAANMETVHAFFDRLESSLEEDGLNTLDPEVAHRMWNCDETAFCTSSTSQKLLCKRGVRSLHEVGGGTGREHTTVHVCCSASGQRLPPFVLYKAKNMYHRWMQGGPAGCVYGASESGWMDGTNFLSWFRKLFLPAVGHLTSTGPVYLFFDGHYSHISLELIRTAQKSNVKLFCLPPNCTHILQPLDVGVFGPVKKTWGKVVKQWRLETRGMNVSKEAFPALIAQLWAQSLTPAQCISGFKACGILPLSRDAVTSKLGPSSIFQSAHANDFTQRTCQVTCGTCGKQTSVSTSPFVRTRLHGYFQRILEVRRLPSRTRSKTRVRLEGEVITSDEFVELLEKEQDKRAERGKEKASQPTDNPPRTEEESEGKL